MPKIAAIQTSASDQIDKNLVLIRQQIEQAKSQGAELVVLPECFAFMQSSRAQLFESAEVDGSGKIQAFLSVTAKTLDIWIIGGSLPLQTLTAGKVSNTLLAYDNQGKRVARYDKIFLFDVSLSSGERYRESDYTEPGGSLEIMDSPVGKIGLSICYDLRFPEIYRKLTHMGAQLLVVPSAFSHTTGQYHWLPLLQARAIENLCYVIAPAQTGIHTSGRKTWGHTVIIDPWGKVLAELQTECGIVVVDVDLELLRRSREQLPSLKHCRPDLF
jgi:predicted amidohydrolase